MKRKTSKKKESLRGGTAPSFLLAWQQQLHSHEKASLLNTM